MPAIALGVTGSIAAYKACEIASSLTASAVDVHVVMTAAAQELVGPATFRALTGNPVVTGMFHDPSAMPHIHLADVCELLVLAPATANILGRLAGGIADDALSTLALSVDCPVLVAPAMNVRMWGHQAVQENVRRLKDRGVRFVGPATGRLACGSTGAGRMAPPAEVVAAVRHLLGLETPDREASS